MRACSMTEKRAAKPDEGRCVKAATLKIARPAVDEESTARRECGLFAGKSTTARAISDVFPNRPSETWPLIEPVAAVRS